MPLQPELPRDEAQLREGDYPCEVDSSVDLRPHQLLDLLNEERRKNRNLAQANEELRAFAYSVSHDLRTPIRGIDGFTRVLTEEYGDKLDATGLKYLDFIRDSSRRAGKIIDNLMRLSQISRSSVQVEEVSLTELAKEVMENLRREEPDREVDFHVEGKGVVSCDREFMRIALENLLGNAWKFTRQRPRAEIYLRTELLRNAEGKPTELSCVISDNGAGFAMEDVGKLFSPFQRLHSERDFQGFGVGLATVKRVIQKHSGRVWAHSSEGHGATFGFAIPV